MSDRKYTVEDLQIMQAWPLDKKIGVTQTRIMEWYMRNNGNVYVSFSGGLDSALLLDLARRAYPGIPAAFVDTGLEYPEIREFVKTFDNVTWLKPKMPFSQVVRTYGYPAPSKKVARAIRDLRHPTPKNFNTRNLYLTGYTRDGNLCKSRKLAKKWLPLVEADFECSEQCCDITKKEPLRRYQRETGRLPIIGVRTEESKDRQDSWMRNGCNAFDAKYPESHPMSFWTGQDVLLYYKTFGIPYCGIYRDIVELDDGQLTTTGASRTGCMFCMFGIANEKEPNRFQRMRVTHPKQYEYCIETLGCGKVLDYINVPY